jgi:hypothetical protein
MTQNYDYQYHAGYPVWSDECSTEAAFKRTTSMPQPIDVYNYALLGLPKVLPMTGEVIPLEFAETALMSAIAEIEMSTGMNISAADQWHSEDFIQGKITDNFSGIKLPKWPATKIVKVSLKYPNTNTNTAYAEYVFPSAWVFLRKNNVNLTPTYGVVSINNQSGMFVPGSGIYSFFYGILQPYSPGIIEVIYTAGFEHDKIPANLADLIRTWAAQRLLSDLLPIMFPQSSVSVSIDSVSQSVGLNINQMLAQRITDMDKKKKELLSSIKSQYKSVISISYIGT